MSLMLRTLFCSCALILLLVLPAAASPVLVTDSFVPDPPLVPGGQQQVTATYAIPSGTTFPKDHSLQLQTGLSDAQWVIQVILDGNNAARQTAAGSAAFINGEILSYSVNHDVSYTVTVNGRVPSSATGSVLLLDEVEIDNTGAPVPGSEIAISQPVQGSVVTPATAGTALPTLTPPIVTTTTPAARSPGFTAAACGIACLIAGIAVLRFRRGQQPE